MTILCKILTKSSLYVQTLIDRLRISDFESKIICCMGVISLNGVETEPIRCPFNYSCYNGYHVVHRKGNTSNKKV